jgi:hypothetical protein
MVARRNGLGSVLLVCAVWMVNTGRSAEPGDVVCHRATGKIMVDGKGDEPAWKQAEVIREFHHPGVARPSPARTKTEARLLWDDEALYFFAEMEDADLYADVTEQDGTTWDNDVFELFFKPHPERKPYYEFQVTPLNTHFDCCILSRGGGHVRRWMKAHEFRWETKPVLRGTLNDESDKDQGWSVEGRIPWSDFRHTGGKPKAGDVWTLALCRYDYSVDFDAPDLSSTAPFTRVDFHQTENYGKLTFSAE